MRNIALSYHDKKIVLCAKHLVLCAKHLLITRSHPYQHHRLTTLSLGKFHHSLLSWTVVNLSCTSCKTPTLFSWTTFLNFVLMPTTSLLCLCLSSDLLSSLFWSMHIKTLWSFWKSYHCLKYTLIEHTVVSLYKAEHNNTKETRLSEAFWNFLLFNPRQS